MESMERKMKKLFQQIRKCLNGKFESNAFKEKTFCKNLELFNEL
jgi:hypothetical protein